MKVKYRVNAKTEIELECNSLAEVISKLGALGEVLIDEKCAQCGSDSRLEHRNHSGYDFYGLRCNNASCNAELSFGQAREGGRLFVKRRKDGHEIGKNGWHIYQADGAPGGDQTQGQSSAGETSQDSSQDEIPW